MLGRTLHKEVKTEKLRTKGSGRPLVRSFLS